MTVYEIPNIEHCNVREVGNPAEIYRISSKEGWYIHLNDGDEGAEHIWKTAVALPAKYDFLKVQIVAEDDLPDGYQIM